MKQILIPPHKVLSAVTCVWMDHKHFSKLLHVN